MATACYRNFDIPPISQGMSHHLLNNHPTRHHAGVATALSSSLPQVAQQQHSQKDYSIPLHVDCSVEYELPNQAKPPVGTRIEPLLMIHPCYFRKMESQRRSPFINNMPNQQSSHIGSSSSFSSNSMNSSNPKAFRQHSSTSLLRQNHNTPRHHGQLISSNIQLPSSNSTTTLTTSKVRPSHQQINLKQQIDEYVQRQIVQMSAPPPPSIPYSTITSNHNISHINNQNASNNNNNSHYIVQKPQRATSTWDHYSIPSGGQHRKSVHQQPHKTIQCNNSKEVCHISNTIIEGGGLLTTGKWGDVIEKTSSMAAIPRDYQSGPECIPSIIKSNTTKPISANNILHSVGKRDAMLSSVCNIYNGECTNTDVSPSSLIWKPEKVSTSRKLLLDANPNTNKTVTNSKPSSSSKSTPSNLQNNLNYNNSATTQVLQSTQDQRHLLSGKYKQYLRSQRLHPYSMLPGALTAVATESAFPQLGSTPTMFQQISCFNV